MKATKFLQENCVSIFLFRMSSLSHRSERSQHSDRSLCFTTSRGCLCHSLWCLPKRAMTTVSALLSYTKSNQMQKNHRRKGPPFWRRRWSGMEQVLNIVCKRVEWHSQTSQERIYSRSVMQVGTILPSTKHLTSLFTVFFQMLCLCLFIVCAYKYKHMCYGMCVEVGVHLQVLNFASILSLFFSTAACSPFDNLCE